MEMKICRYLQEQIFPEFLVRAFLSKLILNRKFNLSQMKIEEGRIYLPACLNHFCIIGFGPLFSGELHLMVQNTSLNVLKMPLSQS